MNYFQKPLGNFHGFAIIDILHPLAISIGCRRENNTTNFKAYCNLIKENFNEVISTKSNKNKINISRFKFELIILRSAKFLLKKIKKLLFDKIIFMD